MAKSILQTQQECYVCRRIYNVRTPYGLEVHHIFPGNPGRELSERNGLKVWLCQRHHNMPPYGVHYDAVLAEWLKQQGQLAFEREHSRAEFVQQFGENHL